jgi:hypothetical protein
LLKPTAKRSNNKLLEASLADKDSELSTMYEGTSCRTKKLSDISVGIKKYYTNNSTTTEMSSEVEIVSFPLIKRSSRHNLQKFIEES